jgi:hypothetical protein
MRFAVAALFYLQRKLGCWPAFRHWQSWRCPRAPKGIGAARSSAGGGKNKSAAGLFPISIE